ncbi:MAG TPA: nucleoside recognition domain-containing protein [Candidatus Coprenecus stercorigallinarum]|nr:nucleoside recognition domain-containing protein [Candidatus Coprenecus stercorigallinarum]
MTGKEFGTRSRAAVKRCLPSTKKTAIWMIKITVAVSFAIMLLGHFGVIEWISVALSPVFVHFGLPGEAALAYVSGYFVNMYSAIAAAVTLDLDPRAVTILGVMALCSHNMIVESAVQHRTGSSTVRVVLVRTLSGIILAYLLNMILPGESPSIGGTAAEAVRHDFGTELTEWLKNTGVLVPKMLLIIFALNILQALMSEFGIIRVISRALRPVMHVFGLSSRCAVLWIIANTLGLAYGAAAMIDEASTGKLRKEDIDGLNMHIGISHSNLEDVILLTSVGAVWWVLLVSRWAWAMILVWGYRLEVYIRKKYCIFVSSERND